MSFIRTELDCQTQALPDTPDSIICILEIMQDVSKDSSLE